MRTLVVVSLLVAASIAPAASSMKLQCFVVDAACVKALAEQVDLMKVEMETLRGELNTLRTEIATLQLQNKMRR